MYRGQAAKVVGNLPVCRSARMPWTKVVLPRPIAAVAVDARISFCLPGIRSFIFFIVFKCPPQAADHPCAEFQNDGRYSEPLGYLPLMLTGLGAQWKCQPPNTGHCQSHGPFDNAPAGCSTLSGWPDFAPEIGGTGKPD